jgi:glutathione reductase (NADPH)
MAFDYDLFVIGGGSGGVRAARIAAAEHGARVGLAEEYRMGGTCVIRGCVPKKLMVFASGFPGAVADARAYGWEAQIGGFDWPAFHTKLEQELARLEGIYRANLTRAGVEVHDCRATLAGPHEVALADGRIVTAKHILIATGGRPVVPEKWANVPGIMTSNDIFLMPELPQSVLIVGGGYIASEFACIFNGLGVKTTQFYRGAQILRGFDDEARGHIAQEMIANGVDLHLGTDILEMERREGGTWVKSTTGHDRTYDAIIFATGRAPATEGLGLEALGADPETQWRNSGR